MAREHSSWPGQSAAMVTSVIAGITITPPNAARNIVTNRWLSPVNPSMYLNLVWPFMIFGNWRSTERRDVIVLRKCHSVLPIYILDSVATTMNRSIWEPWVGPVLLSFRYFNPCIHQKNANIYVILYFVFIICPIL